MAQYVTVVDYDSNWLLLYQRERQKIADVLQDNCIALYHIGSTSVPGLAAKPVIDIMAAVKSLEKTDEKAAEFEKLGYEYMGEFGIKGRRYLRKGGDRRTHQIHIFGVDNMGDIVRHLAFRDYLRKNAEEAERYAALKKQLAERYPRDIEAYCRGKEDYVAAVEKTALAVYDDTWDRLYFEARKVQGGRSFSHLMTGGQVAAALITSAGNIYTGVCIDSACSLGMCAERNAMANMITCGEHEIKRIVAVMPDGRAGMPCGACREFMMQTDENAGGIKILRSYETKEYALLSSIVPEWWYNNKEI